MQKAGKTSRKCIARDKASHGSTSVGRGWEAFHCCSSIESTDMKTITQLTVDTDLHICTFMQASHALCVLFAHACSASPSPADTRIHRNHRPGATVGY